MSWIPAKKNLFLWFTLLMGVALVYSRFLISVCMFAWLIMAFLSWSYDKNRPVIASGVSKLWSRLFDERNRAYLLLTGLFFSPLLFGFHSGDWGEFMERLRIKLPFLGLPIAFLLLPALGKKAWNILLVFFNVVLISSAFYVLYRYAIDFEAINEGLEQGIPMPTPVNHLRYSLMIALTVLLNATALFKNRNKLNDFQWWGGIAATVFLISFLHILSIRSGLAVFYCGALWLIICLAWIRRSIVLGLLLAGGVILLPMVAYYASPSLQKKVGYMRYDIQQYLKGEGEQYSDSERIYSLQAGWAVFRENPWIGVGTGDVRKAVSNAYQKLGYDGTKLPHNQFVTVLAANGLLGLLLFVYCLIKPFLDRRRRRSIYFSSFFIVLFLSFLVENTIENSVGVAFHLVFMLLLLHRERSRSDDPLPNEVV